MGANCLGERMKVSLVNGRPSPQPKPRMGRVRAPRSRNGQESGREIIPRPSRWKFLTELPRSIVEWATIPAASPLLASAPRGDGHSVLVIPGFLAGDGATRLLRRYLAWLGYEVHRWELGRNLGWSGVGRNLEVLSRRLRAIHDQTGHKVSLVGWSLGGVMARKLARLHPSMVRQVISIGAPFTGNPNATSIRGLYEVITGEQVTGTFMRSIFAESRRPVPVRAISLYSKSDGIVAWQNCLEPRGPLSENIELVSCHCAMMANPAVLYALADRLGQAEGSWSPFDRGGWRGLLYPQPSNPGH